MHIVIAGATGLIGKHLIQNWLQDKRSITVIGRSLSRIKKTFGDQVSAITWEGVSREMLATADIVVNLAGANIGARRWTKGRKTELIQSRVTTTLQLTTLLAAMEAPPAFFSASAVSIYGLQKQIPDDMRAGFDEESAIDGGDHQTFLAQIAREWEKAAAPLQSKGSRLVFLRFGVVLAKDEGALPQLVLPFRLFLGGPLGSGDQPFSWVEIEDVVKAINFLIDHRELNGAFNIVAPQCVTQAQLAAAIGRTLHRPSSPLIPAFILKIILGEMADELLLEGQYAYPQRLLEAGFRFKYSNIDAALQVLLKK